MEQYFFGHDSELQAMRICIKHDKTCEFYRRSTNTPLCLQCKEDIEKKNKLPKGTDSNNVSSNFQSSSLSPNTVSVQKSISSGYNLAAEKDKIQPISQYTQDFFSTVEKKYDEMMKLYNKKKEQIQQKDKIFKIESQIMMSRLQKFISYMLMDAQREMHKNLDLHQKRIKKEIDEFESLLKEEKYWEIIYKKEELKGLKKKMSYFMNQYDQPEINLYGLSKLELLKNLFDYMKIFMEVLEFTIIQIEEQLEKQMNKGFSEQFNEENDINQCQANKDFDFLLDSPSIKNLKVTLSQKRYFIEKPELLSHVKQFVDNMEFKYRKDENAKSLISEYNSKLENLDLKKSFVRIQKENFVYYGDVNDDNMRHGIGTLIYDNGFRYHGMFENDQISGMGISTDDQKFIKYIGEHKNGNRDGKGILIMPDGKEYEGAWRKNRMHGKGIERLVSGEQYMVFSNNGKRMDFLTMGKSEANYVSRGAIMTGAFGNQNFLEADREKFIEPHRQNDSQIKNKSKISQITNSSSQNQLQYFVKGEFECQSPLKSNDSHSPIDFKSSKYLSNDKKKEKCTIF